MAHQWVRCNLAAASFPFATTLMGRTIILPQFDMNFDRTVQATVPDVERDKGIPQAFYMHNCMPTAQGYQSIGYNNTVAPFVGKTDFDSAFPIQNSATQRFLFVPAVGKNYIFDAVVGAWASVSPFPVGTVRDSVIVTVATVQAQSYIYYANYGCFTYDSVLKVLTPVALAGLVAANTRGVCEANGFMIAWDGTTVAWSNPAVPTDFVPSVLTGAGGGAVGDAMGQIIACLPISGGFLIYCEKNVVAAKFTSNFRAPFVLTEVPGSGGISSPEQVSWQANLAEHYSWTTVGLQKLSLTQSAEIFPEATDFLAALIYEDFDEASLTFSMTYLSTPLSMKVALIGDRYVVMSYGVAYPNFTYALVYDLSLKRWGKLKINHRDCFQWNNPNLYGGLTYGQLTMTYGGFGPITTYGDLLTSIQTPDVPKKTLAFLQQDGTVVVVDFDYSEEDANGVLMIGKFQHQRNKFLVHQSTDVETVRHGPVDMNNFKMYVIASLDGKDTLPPVLGVIQNYGALGRRYNKRITGMNFSDLFIGSFNLTSMLINYTLGGDR